MRKQLLHILIISFVFLVPNVARATEGYDFMSAIINSIESCKIAKERLMLSNYEEDLTGSTLMKDIIVTNNKIKEASRFIEPYILSKNEATKSAAEQFAAIYTLIIQNNEELLDFTEHTYNNIEDLVAKQGTYSRKLSELMATSEELWRLLPTATVSSAYALVDNDRTEDGKLKFLNINSEEAGSLIDQLVNTFGEVIKSEPKEGILPIDFSATGLYIFLGKGWKYADSK